MGMIQKDLIKNGGRIMKRLVAYFSAEGNTKRVAERLAAAAGADIFEIRPKMPYTAADIRWTNPLARCNREKLGKKDVPIARKLENPGDYDIIFLGFPIWYYGAPNIIQTFLKENDLSGRRIALFATSGGSDMGRTAEKLEPYLDPGARIVASRLFSPAADEAELLSWAEGI